MKKNILFVFFALSAVTILASDNEQDRPSILKRMQLNAAQMQDLREQCEALKRDLEATRLALEASLAQNPIDNCPQCQARNGGAAVATSARDQALVAAYHKGRGGKEGYTGSCDIDADTLRARLKNFDPVVEQANRAARLHAMISGK